MTATHTLEQELRHAAGNAARDGRNGLAKVLAALADNLRAETGTAAGNAARPPRAAW